MFLWDIPIYILIDVVDVSVEVAYSITDTLSLR